MNAADRKAKAMLKFSQTAKRGLWLVPGIVLFSALLGCAPTAVGPTSLPTPISVPIHTSTSPQTSTPEANGLDKSVVAKSKTPNAFIGLGIEAARALAREQGKPFRVVKLDGVDLAVIRNFVRGRVNAEVVDGRVSAFAVEGSSKVSEKQAVIGVGNIPKSCLSFFDGCNQCRRNSEGAPAACTKKACPEYQKAKCLDP